MYIKNQTLTLTYRLLYLGLCGYGILRHLSVSDSIRNINMLSYFTIQSNILCFIVMLFSCIHTIRSILKEKEFEYSRILLFFRGMSFLVITITFFTYSVVLTQVGFSMDSISNKVLTVNDCYVHYMIPILTWADFIFFQPKPKFKKTDPLKWLAAPFIYFVFILIKGKYMYARKALIGLKRYPYFFLDAQTYGYPYVFMFAMLFLVACIIIGYVICLLDFSIGMFYTKLICKFKSKNRNWGIALLTIKQNELDIENYLAIRAAANWKKLTTSQARKALDNSLLTVTAYLDGKVVGMGRIVGDGAVICYIQDLVVLPGHQKLGIGKKIINTLIEYVDNLKEEGSEMMLCLMCAKGRETFYEGVGFTARPTDNLGPGMIMYLKN